MKINFILPGLGDSGGIQVVLKYVELLKQQGEDVIVYSSISSPNLHRYHSPVLNIAHQIYCTIKTCNTARRDQRGIKWVWKIDDKHIRPSDITIATMWATAFEVSKLKNSRKKAYFIQGYEIWDNEEYGRKSYELPLEHIVIAKWINDILVNQIGCKPGYLVHNGMDTNLFHPNSALREQRREDGKVQCLMLYHNLSKKGVDDGVAAYRKAKESHPELTLLMFGMPENPHIDCVDKYYQNPEKNKLVELYQTSDIFIFPSREEGWGLTPVEAMACGCAVAGTHVGCMTEIGEDGVNCLISEPNDIDNLYSNLMRLIDNQQLRKHLGEEGRMTAEGLSWTKSCETLIDALRYICED
jgi:glycosyltransferase involved in cell wall biosynthesis